MRMFRVGLLAALALGCGDSGGPSGNRGDLAFVLDAQSCPSGSVSIDMIVDGTARGTATFSPGTRHRVEVDAGTHIASARITNTDLGFSPANVTVPAGGEASYVMFCG